MRTRRAALLVAAAAAVSGAAPALAQGGLQNVELHGYGGWSYGRTQNANFFTFGHQGGDYSHVEYALNVGIQLNDHLRLDAQPFWHGGHHANQTESGIDYAFGEWKYSDAFRLRVGAVKQPFGIYTEVFDVGTVRPFGILPQSVYGPVGMIGKAYDGVGFTGSYFAQSGWGVTYDAYGGGLDVNERDVQLQVATEGDTTAGPVKALNVAVTRTLRNVAGGRVMLHLPISGVNVGASGYTGTRPLGAEEVRRTTYGTHAEYLSDSWSLRAEYVREREDVHDTPSARRRTRSGYVEAAYRLTERWQAAGLWDRLDTEVPGASAANIARAPSLLEHKEWAAGLNYWFTPNFVLKGSYHWVDGNRFASPADLLIRATVAAGRLQPKTNMFIFGGQLSF